VAFVGDKLRWVLVRLLPVKGEIKPSPAARVGLAKSAAKIGPPLRGFVMIE